MNLSPVPENERERLKALQSYQILDTQSEKDFDRLTELASLICDAPMSMVTLIDDKRQWFKSNYGLEMTETSRDLAFCRYTILGDSLLEIEDASLDERFDTNIYVTETPNVRFYAGHPLVDPNGYSIGTICVFDSHPKKLTDHQKQALKLLAEQVMSLIVDQRKREERRNFDRLFTLSNDLICIAGTDGFFKKINPAFGQVLGWDEHFLLNTHFFDLVHPDDREQTARELARLSTGESGINFVQRLKSKNGDYVFIQWVTTPEPATGNMFAIGRNITEEKIKEEKLKISEDNFRTFFENSQGLMCTHDLDGRFLTVNSAGAALLGYVKEEVLKLSLFDLIPARHHQILEKYLHEIRENGISSGLMTTQHRDGSYRIWSYHNILIEVKEGADYVVGNSIDVTESHRLAKSLEKMQEMLLQTNQLASVGGWEVDVRQNKLYWSDITKQIHQVDSDYVPDLATGLSFYKKEESFLKISEAVNLALKEGKSYDLELELTTAKGKELWVRSIGHAEFENGRCKKLYGMFQDIDERKKAELEIVNAKKLLDDVLNAASEVSIIATDVEGTITVFNKGAEKLLGYTADEVVGKSTPEFIHLKEELQKRSEELSTEYGFSIEGFRTFVYKAESESSEIREWTYRSKSGELLPVSLVVTTIRDYNNTIIGYLGVATDLSASKKAEQELFNERARLLAFVEHAPAAVAMLDRDVRYLAVSRKWIDEYKLQEQHIIGMSHYEVFPNIGEEWKNMHQRVLQGETISRDEDLWMPQGWNQAQFLKWELRPWYQFDGSVGGIMMFTEDITETTRRQEELRQAKLQSEQASIAKSEFLANMSHEIRTPLNGVIGFTDLVLKTKMNDTQKQYLGIVNQSANALLSIINDILDFSKIEAGKLELDVDKCDIYDITAQSADIISFPIQNKGLEMLLNIPANLPRFVWVDEIRLKQVLINLLSNAAKFTESGEIELKIEILNYQPEESQDITCRFIVRDTGIGIREEKQAKIFEAFLQEDGSTTKKYGGTGLGLTISNKLLAMMGSQLQLKSVLGVGSTFFFDMTLLSEPGEPIVWENVDAIKKVLIVDDNDNNRLIMKKMLQLLKIESDQVKNGFEALKALDSPVHYDAVLMDYHMPYMDGIETIRKIRMTFPGTAEDLPIVLLNSSADDSKVIKACEELKVNYRLMKPIKLNDIFLCLSRLSQKEMIEEVSESVENYIFTSGEMLVLIAEDNPVNMFLAKTIISKITPEAKILQAANGVEAVEFCKKQLPDLIFMDVQMPEMNGYEATYAIRNLSQDRHIPIIALTAGNVKGERDKCIAAGMDDFISKPFVEESIRQAINKFSDKTSTISSETKTDMHTISNEHFDIVRLKDTYMNDQEFITEFLALTRESLHSSMSEFKAHFQTNNLKGIKATGHRLKGASSSAFLTKVTEITQDLEHLETFDEAKIKKLLEDLQNEIDLLIPILLETEQA
ncbi:PAS domain S-box protein [Dyadobacter psychrotolerans]|uniref:Sensory/regulatory protein RpfC n=1 Tax=Dyadobacter psychrotolerans TaxID=2541721 RepID=A0A4R5DSM6_9BACT|nr:PAS domain S-box protein [Dyadobacter psychrotolerans]TDE17486.1 PAS domain S-box protein [Dyadobacter psychrotolerans]